VEQKRAVSAQAVKKLFLKRRFPQHPLELQKVCQWVREANSILEIGSRYGENMRFLAAAMRGNKLVCVDLPDVEGWNDREILDELVVNVTRLNNGGYDVTLIVGDSHNFDVLEKVESKAPYDVVFIDGDHTYQGVKVDWDMYARLGKIVIFHDINPENGLGVSKLWEEIRGNKESYIAPGSLMGVGKVVL
jgi:cephalosporin hydroxylase